jgi:hypothetical protein
VGVAKVLQSGKTPWKYWKHWTFRTLKNAKIQTKTHKMEVLETLENQTLEAHNGDSAHYGLVVQLVRTHRSHR